MFMPDEMNIGYIQRTGRKCGRVIRADAVFSDNSSTLIVGVVRGSDTCSRSSKCLMSSGFWCYMSPIKPFLSIFAVTMAPIGSSNTCLYMFLLKLCKKFKFQRVD